MTDKHTPTPWVLYQGDGDIDNDWYSVKHTARNSPLDTTIYDIMSVEDGEMIAPTIHDAKFIVKAVNSHEPLKSELEALKAEKAELEKENAELRKLTDEKCHVGMFNIEQCKQALKVMKNISFKELEPSHD